GDLTAVERPGDAALVGQAVARRRGLSVGQKFSIGEGTVTVAGIFGASQPADEHFIYTRLDFLQPGPAPNAWGRVTQFEVRVTDDADPERVAREIDETLRADEIATDTRLRGVFEANAVGDLAELINLSHYLGYACLGLVLALVSTTTVMSVQDRVREHAVLQTL